LGDEPVEVPAVGWLDANSGGAGGEVRFWVGSTPPFRFGCCCCCCCCSGRVSKMERFGNICPRGDSQLSPPNVGNATWVPDKVRGGGRVFSGSGGAPT